MAAIRGFILNVYWTEYTSIAFHIFGLDMIVYLTFQPTEFRLQSVAVSYVDFVLLTLWDRVPDIRLTTLGIIGSNNGLSHGRCQAIIWTNAEILLIGPLGRNFSEIAIHTFSLTKMHLKISSVKWRPCCLGLCVLNHAKSSFVLFALFPINNQKWSLVTK